MANNNEIEKRPVAHDKPVENHVAQQHYNFSDPVARNELLDSARSKFTRGGADKKTIDFGTIAHLYGSEKAEYGGGLKETSISTAVRPDAGTTKPDTVTTKTDAGSTKHDAGNTKHGAGITKSEAVKKTEAPAGDGPAKSADKTGDKTKSDNPVTDKQKLDAEKSRLERNLADDMVPSSSHIHENMKTFEDRAAKGDLPKDEVRKTYEQVNHLLESNDEKPITQGSKQMLADQILQHAAHPANISQGFDHGTCNVTSLESRMFTKQPSEAAKVIADGGINGSYTAKDGTKVDLNQNDLKKDDEAKSQEPADGTRSYASKIFQTTALNLHFQKGGERYTETIGGSTPGDRSVFGQKDKEEVIGANGAKRPFDGISMENVSDIESKMTGKQDAGSYLVNNANYRRVHATMDNTKVKGFENQKEFSQALSDAKKNGKLPVALEVDVRQPPFGDGVHDKYGGKGGAHVVSVTDFNEKDGKVSFSNQWGSKNNHIDDGGIPLSTMYDATHMPYGQRVFE